jgi:hypothetical protein
MTDKRDLQTPDDGIQQQLNNSIEGFNTAIKDATPDQQNVALENLNQNIMPALKQADEHISIVQFISATDGEGRDYWAYLNIAPSKQMALADAFKQGGQINYLAYGEELACGWGKEPDAKTKQRMADEYGCKDDFQDNLLASITQSA